jgi:hypothetical protein
VSYEFHSERKRNPEKLKYQVFFVSEQKNISYVTFSIGHLKFLLQFIFCCRVQNLSLDLHRDGFLLLYLNHLHGSYLCSHASDLNHDIFVSHILITYSKETRIGLDLWIELPDKSYCVP